jgi:tRNA A37 threonylcarbamoyladenosine biosynthesis protein TsaE
MNKNGDALHGADEIAKVVVVCGFLGSGKTTLVESILKAPKLSK